MFLIIAEAEPGLYDATEGRILGGVRDDEVGTTMRVRLSFEELLCEWPHPAATREGEAEGGIE